MAEDKSAAVLQAMVERYEQLLRRLLEEANDEDRLFAFRASPRSAHQPTLFESGVHHVHQRVRQFVSYTLHEFHPEIEGQWRTW